MNQHVYTNGILIEQTIDHGDGTGTRTTFDADGNVTSVEQLSGLPIPQPPEPSDAERIASLQATIGVMTETLAQLSPEDIAAATQLAVAFLANKDRLNNAVNSVANNNTAKAPVVVLNDIVQEVGAQ